MKVEENISSVGRKNMHQFRILYPMNYHPKGETRTSSEKQMSSYVKKYDKYIE